jgi:hypothetical protein
MLSKQGCADCLAALPFQRTSKHELGAKPRPGYGKGDREDNAGYGKRDREDKAGYGKGGRESSAGHRKGGQPTLCPYTIDPAKEAMMRQVRRMRERCARRRGVPQAATENE